MSYAAVIDKTWERNLLFSVMLELTYRCNLDCWFCYNDLGLEGKPLATGQYLDLLDELAGMQVFNLTLTGGEPLTHPDFFRLGQRARELGFVTVIKSNGHLLGARLAERVADEIDPYLVEISLHGARAETHDRQTRVRGSFDRLMGNIPQMLAAGLRVKVNCTVTAWNEHEIDGMMALVDRWALPLQFDPEVTGRDNGDLDTRRIAASPEGIARVLEVQRQRAEAARREKGDTAPPSVPQVGRQADNMAPAAAGSKHCGAGSSTLTIDPYGNVYPCVQWRRPVGSLHEASIGEIWSGSRSLGEVRKLNQDVKSMLTRLGGAAQSVGFCPGSAELQTGSPLSLHPAARERVSIAGGAESEPTNSLLPIVR